MEVTKQVLHSKGMCAWTELGVGEQSGWRREEAPRVLVKLIGTGEKATEGTEGHSKV